MPYDKKLEERLNKLVAGRRDFYAQKMFGGVGFLLRGNMCFGIFKEYLIIRVGEPAAEKVLKKKGTKPFDITGRAMKGWAMVGPAATKTDTALKQWVALATDFVSQLPRK